jgi:hypothetical protein
MRLTLDFMTKGSSQDTQTTSQSDDSLLKRELYRNRCPLPLEETSTPSPANLVNCVGYRPFRHGYKTKHANYWTGASNDSKNDIVPSLTYQPLIIQPGS